MEAARALAVEERNSSLQERVLKKIINEWKAYYLKTTGATQPGVFSESDEIAMKRRIVRALMYRVKLMGDEDLRRLYMYTNILDEIYSRCVNDVGSGMDSFVEGKVGEFLEKK